MLCVSVLKDEGGVEWEGSQVSVIHHRVVCNLLDCFERENLGLEDEAGMLSAIVGCPKNPLSADQNFVDWHLVPFYVVLVEVEFRTTCPAYVDNQSRIIGEE